MDMIGNPKIVLRQRWLQMSSGPRGQILVQCEGKKEEDTSWEDIKDFIWRFEHFNLEEKAVYNGGGGGPLHWRAQV